MHRCVDWCNTHVARSSLTDMRPTRLSILSALSALSIATIGLVAPATAAIPVSPAPGETTPTAMPTFRWTAEHPGQYSTFLLTGSPAVSGSAGEMSAETIDSATNPNGETSYTPLDPIDAGRAWWQVCEQAPDFSRACFAPREVYIPILLDEARRSYSRATRTIRVSLSGNLWRGGTASVRLAAPGWSRTYRVAVESGSATIDTHRIPRRVKEVTLSVIVSVQGVTKALTLPRVRAR